MYFTITTNRETADQIKAQCEFEAKFNWNRSYVLGDIRHEERYSVVQIKVHPNHEKIFPTDLFWLGHFSAKIETPES